MTDADRMVAHGMGYESAVEATAGVASPGHEEALADLAAENERLRAGMRVLAQKIVDTGEICPPGCEISRDERFCVCEHLPADCWCKWAMEEVEARKAGDTQ